MKLIYKPIVGQKAPGGAPVFALHTEAGEILPGQESTSIKFERDEIPKITVVFGAFKSSDDGVEIEIG